ncbi:dihydrofolate reductase family protein [Microbacterium suaedae]|uniref:dihydrofolate reductase family protein n=1 Tax=Microbacterium suaedae TaxID=2067813 RepID=UPI000DA18275|nr:dihydrofolate reductase family protein [Microbacterium suaedae]
MLLLSMGVSVDGYISDRTGDFHWGTPDAEQFAFHLREVSALRGLILGRRLYETMRIWETDPTFPSTPDESAFAEAWTALPKLVFSRTLRAVEGLARIATGDYEEEIAAFMAEVGGDVEIGGPDVASQAIVTGLVDEFRIFRSPIIVGGGTPLLPHVADPIPLELVETRTFASRIVYERYRRAERSGSAPSAPKHDKGPHPEG